jgi:hypothetical protein
MQKNRRIFEVVLGNEKKSKHLYNFFYILALN